MLLPLLSAAAAGLPSDVSVDVDWPSFLGRHDLLWDWEWGSDAAYTIQPRSGDLGACGRDGAAGECCLSAVNGSRRVALSLCEDGDEAQHWTVLTASGGSMLKSVAAGTCLTNATPAALSPCGAGGQVFGDFSGFFVLSAGGGGVRRKGDGPQPDALCLGVDTGTSFCDYTVCPFASAVGFRAGMPVTLAPCHNGDRSQMFATYTIPTAGERAKKQNLVPLTWAVSAYVGNGLVGVRVQSEEGGTGVLRVLVDNVLLGAGGHRLPTGYFRLHTNALGLPLRVTLRQRLHDAVLLGEVTRADGSVACNFTAFVSADHTTPAAVVHVTSSPSGTSAPPSFEWVSQGKTDFAWRNVTGVDGLTLYAYVSADGGADAVVARAASAGRDAVLANHTQWWAAYWPQSFVSVESTRVEGAYYTQMYRFPSSDRVSLHGLMGAFGPTGNYNFWGDFIWDMNEQVMYWISPASNRPEISAPMLEYVPDHDVGLWMTHNYVKQARFEGRDDLLSGAGWAKVVSYVKAQAGARRESHGQLKLKDGVYHLGTDGCTSPEYRCYPPFEGRACSPKEDCNYGLSQLRWGLVTALELTQRYNLSAKLAAEGVDQQWWRDLLEGALAWYPHDETGFKLDADCQFACPHRHFSHLLQIFDLETVSSSSNESVRPIILRSIDHWYNVTCNSSNWFNEECRGFTRCGLVGMNAVNGRAEAAAGNLSALVDTVITPNGMYGEMVYQSHPEEFSPVSESAYCGAGVLHTMLSHTPPSADSPLHIFGGTPWADAVFHQLRASGGVLVSARRSRGTTEFIRLLSANASRVQFFTVPGDGAWADRPRVIPAGTHVAAGSSGGWAVRLTAGTPVLLYPASGSVPTFSISALPGNSSEFNWFGYRREMQPLH